MVYYSVWVGGLKGVVQERDLTEKFSQYGDVKHVRIFRDKETKKSLHNGFVVYGQKSEAEHAGRMAHQTSIHGGPIIARTPSEQESRGYSGVYTGKIGYTPRINGDKRPYTDCVHYLNSVCTNGSHCPYRHKFYSHTTRLCPLWNNDRACTDIDCPMRHPGSQATVVNDSQDVMVVPLYTSVLSSDENNDDIRLASYTEYERIKAKFNQDWAKGTSPNVKAVFIINNDSSKVSNFEDYKASLQWPYQQTEEHYHGTNLICDITRNKDLCCSSGCGICRISDSGFDRRMINSNIRFQRFGPGFYLAPKSSKCHDYTQGAYTYRALLLCDVCPGRKYTLKKNDTSLSGPPCGYDSIYGEVGRDLNYEEIVLYNANAILPKYIIVYRKDGVDKIAK